MSRAPLNTAKAISLIGSAKALNIAFGLLKMKVAAVMLGPAGVGLISLFQQLMATISTLFGMGLRNSGTRQLADARSTRSAEEFISVRRALFWGTLGLAICGAALMFFARDLFATHVLQDPLRHVEIGWLALGVAVSVGTASQHALLNGLRQVRDIAQITALSGAISAVIAIIAMFFWRDYAVIIFVLAAPFASFLLGHIYVARLPKIDTVSSPAREMTGEFGKMVRLGSTIMLAALVVSGGHLAVRSLIQRELGPEALGLFSAAWLISQNYIGFLYNAITMDFFPRLTAAMQDREIAARIIIEQIELGLLFAAPIFMFMMTIVPYALWLLYTDEFVAASNTLRWFILGDILQTVAHPLSFALLAAGIGWTHFNVKLIGMLIFVVGAALLMPYFGTTGAGMSYLLMYALSLPLLLFFIRRQVPLRFPRRVVLHFAATSGLGVTVAALAQVSEIGSVLLGLTATVVLGAVSIRRLRTVWRKSANDVGA